MQGKHIGLQGVFGRGVRERLIATLAVNHRGYVASLARSIGVSKTRTASAVRFFEARGVLCVERRSWSRTWVAIHEGPLRTALIAFGRRLAQLEHVASIEHRPRRGPVCKARRLRIDDLFVSGIATRILLYVAEARDTDAKELHRLLGADEAVVRATVRRLIKDGLLRRKTRDWKRIPIVLNERYAVAKELRRLLLAIVAIRPETRAVVRVAARRRRSLVPPRLSKKDSARRGLPRAVDLLPLFHPAQARVLVALASCGPLSGAALGRRIGRTSNAARFVARTLIGAGMVTAAPRSRTITYALDPSHALARPLWMLLRAACRAAVLRVSITTPPANTARRDWAWPPDDRGRAALALALAAAGPANIGTLAKLTRTKRRYVAKRVALLRDARFVKVESIGGSTFAKFAPARLARESTVLLDAMRSTGMRPDNVRAMGDWTVRHRYASQARR